MNNSTSDDIFFDIGFAEATREAGQPIIMPHGLSPLQALAWHQGVNAAMFQDEMLRLVEEESTALKR